MLFQPDNLDEVVRLYAGGASVRSLARACDVSLAAMTRLLEDQGVYKIPGARSSRKSNRRSPERPQHIEGQELSEAWWNSNNQAFCDAMKRQYPGTNFRN
jgi:hypothetical protein